jgi:hypothetical protein
MNPALAHGLGKAVHDLTVLIHFRTAIDAKKGIRGSRHASGLLIMPAFFLLVWSILV